MNEYEPQQPSLFEAAGMRDPEARTQPLEITSEHVEAIARTNRMPEQHARQFRPLPEDRENISRAFGVVEDQKSTQRTSAMMRHPSARVTAPGITGATGRGGDSEADTGPPSYHEAAEKVQFTVDEKIVSLDAIRRLRGEHTFKKRPLR